METLLLKYVKEKAGKYIEPTRQGTAKGDPIGFSAVKYLTTLLSMTSLKIKEIADASGVSYGLLRVWRTEPDYMKMIDSHITEFSGRFIRNIFLILEEMKFGEDYALGFEHYEKMYKDVLDISIYSEDLLESIYKQAKQTMIPDFKKERFFTLFLSFAYAIRKSPITCDCKKEIDNGFIATLYSGQTDNSTFSFIEALQRPWTPDAKNAEQIKGDFIKSIRKL
jgi:hypothetical protein